MRTLIPSPYGPSITNLNDGAFRGLTKGKGGPIRTAPVPFTLDANVPKLVANDNFRRKGLIIKNLDSTNQLYIGFSIQADTNSFFLDPLGAVLFDFVCPTDAIWCFATANIQGMLLEFSQSS